MYYSTQHKKKYLRYRGTSREAILKVLKLNYRKQEKMIKNFASSNATAEPKASYDVSQTLAKDGKAFRDREIIKECAIKIALAFGDKGQAKKIKKVSLSHQTFCKKSKRFE